MLDRFLGFLKRGNNESGFTYKDAISIFILVFFIPCMVASNVGKTHAKEKINFDVLYDEAHGNLAIVSIYDSVIVTVPFDETKKLIGNYYVLYDISNITNKKIINKAIGPLKKKRNQK